MLSPILAALDRIGQTAKPAKTYVAGLRDLSYGTLFDRVRRLTALFAEIGLARDDRAVISQQGHARAHHTVRRPCPQWHHCGCPQPDAPAAKLCKLIETADAKALFLDEERAKSGDLDGDSAAMQC